jgi:RPA family protein
MEKNQFIRKIAYKTSILELLELQLIEGSQEESDYLLNLNGEKMFRHNIIAIILQKERVGSITTFLVEDGTGNITIRFFESSSIIEEVSIGDVILIVGKVRNYNQEKYFSPEIVKKVSPAWMKLRSLELGETIVQTEPTKIIENVVEVQEEERKRVQENTQTGYVLNQNEEETSILTDIALPFEKITNLINELDDGTGVLMEVVIEKSPLPGTEEILTKMLEKGDVFQVSPGKIKVL